MDGVKLFYRESHPGAVLPPSGKSVMLLHGQVRLEYLVLFKKLKLFIEMFPLKAFSSATWQLTSLPTIQTLSALGHRVVAVDLPGGFVSYSQDNVNIFILREI